MCFGYLVWWDNQGIYSGIFGEIKVTDVLAIIVGSLLILISLAAIVFSFRERKYLWTLLPGIVFAIYYSRIIHGEKVFSFRACDMSICDKLELYSDGTFYFRSSAQLETWTKVGRFELKNDTVVLYPTGWRMSFSRLKELENIENRNCVHIKPIGFKVPYGDKLCREE